jgi:FkbM family methyltransferase
MEAYLVKLAGRAHDADLEGLRQIAVPSGALFLDIGANRGAASASIWTMWPHARLVAFEPNPMIVEKFGGLTRRRGGEIHIAALGDQPGDFPLHIPVYRGVVFDGLASLDENEAAGWLNSDTLFGFDKRRLEIRKVLCRVATLDSFNLRPFFIKIDVQGRERQVIAGGLETIAASRPIVFAESESLDIEQVLSMMSAWDYKVFRFDGLRFHEGASRTNVYFIPAEKLNLIRLAGH